MKRILSIITILGTAVTAFGQVSSPINPIAVGQSVYNTQEWANAFAGSYGVNPGIEPGVPDDPIEREVLGQIRTFLQDGTDTGVANALTAIETMLTANQAEGKKASPMILQIAGTLAMRLAEAGNSADRPRMLKKAETYLERAIDPQSGFPNFLRAHKNLANLYFRSDRSKEAKVHFTKALELGDKDAITYGLLGAIYMEEGKLISSESALRNSLMINPNVTEFKQLLGNVLLQQERYNEAKEIFTELLLIKPNEVNFWMAQSNCYIALDMIDEATKNLEMVRMMGKSNVPSLMLLGDVYMNKNMVNEATDAYLEAAALSNNPSDINGFIRASRTLNSYASYNNALQLVEAIRSKGDDVLTDEHLIDLLTISSQLNIALGKGGEAAENLINLLKRDPFNPTALLTLADYYANLKPDEDLDDIESTRQIRENQRLAFVYFERAQNLEDIDAQVKAYLGQAMLHVKRDELKDAADALEDAQGLKYQDNVQSYLTQVRAALQSRR